MPDPTFTVAVATYGRSTAITATLQSIAAQTLTDFEVLVVSDGPPADGLEDVVARFDDRFRLLVLPQRVGSQSGPNNQAIANAGGSYIAYLGHDDIWHPHHLAKLRHVFATHPEAGFAVSGALISGAVGSDTFWVTGLIDVRNPVTHFYPPSSVAHVTNLPRWPDPTTTSLPVDSAFMLRALEQGARFCSTR